MESLNTYKPKYIYPLILIVLAVFLFLGRSRYSLYVDSINEIIYTTCLLIPVVIGVQLLLVTGYFDLSLGSIVCLTGLLTTYVTLKTQSLSLGVTTALLGSIAVGFFNGFLVSKFKIHSLIVTVASTSIIIGLCFMISNGSAIVGLPESFNKLSHGKLFGVSLPIYISLFLFICMAFASNYLIIFRRFYQVGSNPTAALSAGINVDYYIRLAYVFSAIGAALVGFLEISRTMAATPVANNTLALDLIAACVIGGSTLTGGKGSITGCVLGLVLMKSIEFIVILYGLDLYWRYLATGLLILLISIINKQQLQKT